ncbi:MAG: response regulator [Deltaproteobacteria bacterium]|nr:response regulator [Deltaproteobacteria bacterium]
MENTILFVDDEKNILNSLLRIFRRDGYTIYTADNGREGLEIIKNKRISLVVSDHRMPEMEGVDFLSKVKEASPYTVRLMLTGYADIKAVMAAVNRGEVYKYITKPWNDDELKLVVKGALEHYNLTVENRVLQELTKRQNAELTVLNAGLEEKIKDKTRKIHDNFFAFVRIFVNMIELYDQHLGSHSKRVAAMSRGLALHMKLNEADVDLIESAALLHNIGLVGIPREILEKEDEALSETERAVFYQNPVLAQDLLSQLDLLRQVGIIIRSHMEKHNGCGYPDGLRGDEIHIGSKIIAVCKTYDNLRHRGKKPLLAADVIHFIEEHTGQSFDPEVVASFLDFIKDWKEETLYQGINASNVKPLYLTLELEDMRAGMSLARDITTSKGRLLVTKGTVLSAAIIDKVVNFNRLDPIIEHVLVNADSLQKT